MENEAKDDTFDGEEEVSENDISQDYLDEEEGELDVSQVTTADDISMVNSDEIITEVEEDIAFDAYDYTTTEREHLRKIREASNNYLASCGKLGKVCPVGVHRGYAIYECGLKCELMNKDKVLHTDPNLNDEERVVSCYDCGQDISFKKQCMSIQAELRKFFEQQQAGLDTSFRCVKCRDCKQCFKGAGEELKSMQQEAHQSLIRESICIDKKLKRAVAKLPFTTDPSGKCM